MKKLLTAAFSLLFTMGYAQTDVAPYTPGITENGITYFLPRTAFHLTVTAKKVTYMPGEFCKYAEQRLRLKDVTMRPYETWEITSMKIVPYGVADSARAYTIKMNAKSSAPLVGMAPDGRLLSVNAEAPALPKLEETSSFVQETTRKNASDYKTQDILLAGSTAKMAELAAEEIFDIRENRSLLAKGQADFMPKDGEQLRLMLASLDDQEEGLLQLFKGYTTTEVHTYAFNYVPEGEVKGDLIFRFSKHVGFVDADDLSGAPVVIQVKDLKSLPPIILDEKKKDKKDKEVKDLRYIVPGRAEVKLLWDNQVVSTFEVPMAQFGRVEHLGGDLFNKNFATHVLLSPENGGLVKIDVDLPGENNQTKGAVQPQTKSVAKQKMEKASKSHSKKK